MRSRSLPQTALGDCTIATCEADRLRSRLNWTLALVLVVTIGLPLYINDTANSAYADTTPSATASAPEPTAASFACEYTKIEADLSRSSRPVNLNIELVNGKSSEPQCVVDAMSRANDECQALYAGGGMNDPFAFEYVDDCIAWKVFKVQMFALGPDNIHLNQIHDSFGDPYAWTDNAIIGTPELQHQYCVATVNKNRWKVVDIGSSCDSEYESSQWFSEMQSVLYIKQNPDHTCSSVASPPEDVTACYAGAFIWYTSPISLIWDAGTDIDNDLALVKFPLDPRKGDQWSVWKASKHAPLLVFDPEHTGNIKSASQLFGDWTFGGRDFARLDNKITDLSISRATPWLNGYEPLATMDKNGDGKISGQELSPLALWFDENRNGIADAGEVKTLSEVGVTNLFYTANRTDKATNSEYADRGFERVVDGKVIAGTSVDWRSDTATVKAELINKHLAAGLGCPQLHSSSEPNVALGFGKDNGLSMSFSTPVLHKDEVHKRPPRTKQDPRSISGLWKWKSDSLNQPGDLPEGYFGFKDAKDGSISGHSYTSFGVNNREVGFSNIFSATTLKGDRKQLKHGEIALNFSIAQAKNSNIESHCTFDPSEQKIYGRTVAAVSNGNHVSNLNYSWVAYRVQSKQ